MLNWIHKHRTPLPGIASLGLRWNKGGGERFEVGNLSVPISPLLLAYVDGATTLPFYWILSLGVDGC